jgi:hypothetical protein
MKTFTLMGSSILVCTEPVVLFGESVPLYVQVESADGPTEKQLAAITAIESVGDRLLEDIRRHARAYCEKIELAIDLEEEGIFVDHERIEDHIRFKSIAVPKLNECSGSPFFLDCDCDWEPEHGMQLVVEDEAVVFCNSYSLLFATEWDHLIELSPEDRRRELKSMMRTR